MGSLYRTKLCSRSHGRSTLFFGKMGRLAGQKTPALENGTLSARAVFPTYWVRGKNFVKVWKNPLSVAAGLGVSAFVILTDWKVLVNNIPVYGKQFKTEE